MQLGLTGKTALISGGSAGIGLACARALAEEGVDIVIAARDETRLAAAQAELAKLAHGRVIALRADFADGAGIARAVDEAISALGRIDILINNAGSAVNGPFMSATDDAFHDAWTLKMLGAIRATRAVLPGMVERRDGRIVNIIGYTGRAPRAVALAGSTVNAALLNFTRGLARDVAASNVRINAISPGITATERTERAVLARAKDGKSLAEARADMVSTVPLLRMTQPAEIGAMAAFLVSDLAASMTGGEILMDGGATPGI
jgi:NAD(P)-dependent dehydrogenase (short-subunit alcohol dehydrogenase family)